MTINGSTSSSAWTYKLEASESNVNITNNTSVVTVTAYLGRASSRSYIGGTWSGSITVNGSTQNMSGTIPYPTYIDGGGWYALATKSYTVTHNDDGSKTVGISSSWSPEAGVVPTWASASGNMTLTTIARKSTVSCTNGNIGSNVTISISRKSSSFTHTLTYSFGSLSGTIATKTNLTSVSWTLPDTFYAETPNSNEKTGTITCTTYNGNTSLGSNTCSFKAFVTDADPTYNPLWLEQKDVNSTTLALTNNQEIIIKGYSRLLVRKWNNAIPKKSATIKEYKVENQTQPYDDNFQHFYFNNYAKDNYTFYAIDSRNNSCVINHVFDYFVNYFDVTKGNISLTRSQGGVGEDLTLNYNGTFWNGNFGNFQGLQTTGVDNVTNLIATYRYKKTTDSTWTTGTTTINPTTNNNNYSFNGQVAGDTQSHGFDINSSYDFEVTISDSLSTTTFSAILGAGKPAIAIYGNKVALGDKYDTSLGGIQLWGDIYVNGNRIS